MDGNQLSTQAQAALPAAVMGGDPFAAYGAKVGQQGLFVTFKAGEFMAGQNAETIPLGTRLAANVAGLRIGWKRWFGSQVTDDMLELLIDQKPIAPRNTLGDLDPALWELDDQGQPRDPWQLTNELSFSDSEGQIYIYATASKGGIGAIGRLCASYGKLYRQKPGLTPVVELGADSYMHPKYKKTYFPVFEIVDWVDADEAAGPAEEEAGSTQAEAAAPAQVPAPAPPTAPRKARF